MVGRFYRKIGSLLGLLAILMVTLAPAVSQCLAHNRDEDAVSRADCSMPSMSSMPAMQDHAPGQKSAPHASRQDDQPCGYCNLLAHTPAMPAVQAPFAITVRAIHHPIATRFESVRRVEPLTPVQPRAPPVSS